MYNKHILKDFKLGNHNIKVELVDTIKGKSKAEMKFGTASQFEERITLAKGYEVKYEGDIIKGELDERVLIDAYYHELAHIIMDSMGCNNLSSDESFIQFLGERLNQYIDQALDVTIHRVMSKYMEAELSAPKDKPEV